MALRLIGEKPTKDCDLHSYCMIWGSGPFDIIALTGCPIVALTVGRRRLLLELKIGRRPVSHCIMPADTLLARRDTKYWRDTSTEMRMAEMLRTTWMRMSRLRMRVVPIGG